MKARDFARNRTVLTAGSGYTRPNHVLRADKCDRTTELDGFIIEGGNASGPDLNSDEVKGGGIYMGGACDMKVRHCIFKNNIADIGGSAVALFGSGSPLFLDCIFLNNQCRQRGTVWLKGSLGAEFVNCLFADNSVKYGGSAIYLEGSSARVINSSIFRNVVESGFAGSDAAVMAANGSTVIVANSILFANLSGSNYEIAQLLAVSSTINTFNSITQNYQEGANILLAENPRFVDTTNLPGPDGYYFTADDGLQLDARMSPAIDDGDDNYTTGIVLDLAGNARRFNGGRVDIGAYELQGQPKQISKVVYVNKAANGSNDGSSWNNAFTNLQLALWSRADTIKVAAGNYAASDSSIFAAFWLRRNMVMLGGYPNVGSPNDMQRDPDANITVLDGALPFQGRRSLTILFANWVDSTCIVDGFSIVRAYPYSSQRIYSAIHITNKSRPVFRNCVIAENVGKWGPGAQITWLSFPSFINCRFSGNKAYDGGGAIEILNKASAYFFKCQFEKNSVQTSATLDGNGGAVRIVQASGSFDSCDFKLNVSNYYGGAIFAYDHANLQLNACSFFKNSAAEAGCDIYQKSIDSSTISNTVFVDSTITNVGGSLYSEDTYSEISHSEFRSGHAVTGGAAYFLNAQATITNCVFYGNWGDTGGATFANNSTLTMVNCIATLNSSNLEGTALYNKHSNVKLINSILARNSPAASTTLNSSAVITNEDSSTLQLTNSILWWNINGLYYDIAGYYRDIKDHVGSLPSTVEVKLSLTQGSITGDTVNNPYGVEPRMLNIFDPDGPDDKFFTADDGFQLTACSPFIDYGSNEVLSSIAIDINGRPRIFNGIADLGPYEFQNTRQSSRVVFVDSLASGLNDGSSWANAYTDLQNGLKNRCADTIKIASGTYFPAKNDRDSSFNLSYGVVLEGGYDPRHLSPIERDPNKYPTILSGNVGDLDDSLDNSKHVVYIVSPTGPIKLDGLIIENGHTPRDPHGYMTGGSGGGIFAVQCKLAIRNSKVRGNFAYSQGGGAYLAGSLLDISHVEFTNNVANYDGGGVYLLGAGDFESCVFEGNYADNKGGGLASQTRNVRFGNCIFYKNSSQYGGGGVYNDQPLEFYYTNCDFVENFCGIFGRGGGMLVNQSAEKYHPILYNCIFNRNRFSSVPLKGDDYYFNVCDNFNCFRYVFINCLLQSDNRAPEFVNVRSPRGADGRWMTSDDGLRLNACSPFINYGNNDGVKDYPLDMTGANRIRYGIVDLGPYEYQYSADGMGTLNIPSDTVKANKEITDSLGWTHYLHDCVYLLSIRKEGKDIGDVSDGSLVVGVINTAAYNTHTPHDISNLQFNETGDALYAFNKYWFTQSKRTIPDSLLIRFPYALDDYGDLRGASPSLISHQQLSFYATKGGVNAFSESLTTDSVNVFTNDSVATTRTWKYVHDTYRDAGEFYVKKFGSGSALFAIPGPLADLSFSMAEVASDTAYTGKTFYGYCVEKNGGSGLSAMHQIAGYLSSDTVINRGPGGDIPLFTSVVDRFLAAGESTDSLQFQMKIPCDALPGKYYVLFSSDDGSAVAESSEKNNLIIKTLTIVKGVSIPSSVKITSDHNRDTVCVGDSVTLTAMAPDCPDCQITWNTQQKTNSIVVNVSGLYRVQAATTCGGANDEKFIYFVSAPFISPTAEPGSICLGDSVLLQPTYASDDVPIIWNGPGLDSVEAWSVYATPPIAGNLTYTQTGTNAIGCSTTKSIEVVVSPSLPPVLSIRLKACVRPAIFSIDLIENGGGKPIYKWYKNDVLVETGDSTISIDDIKNGDKIYATVKSGSKCSTVDTAKSNVIVLNCIPTGIEELSGVDYFRISPNPTGGVYWVGMSTSIPRKVSMQLLTNTGSIVISLKEFLWMGTVNLRFDIGNRPSGIYFLRVVASNKNYSYPIILIK